MQNDLTSRIKARLCLSPVLSFPFGDVTLRVRRISQALLMLDNVEARGRCRKEGIDPEANKEGSDRFTFHYAAMIGARVKDFLHSWEGENAPPFNAASVNAMFEELNQTELFLLGLAYIQAERADRAESEEAQKKKDSSPANGPNL